MATAKGPIFAAGGFQQQASKGYTLLFLPDIENDDLQKSGQAPVYYWLPNSIRLAQKENNDYVFTFVHFEGVLSGSTTVGVEAGKTNEVAGGVLAFSTTTAPPPDVLKEIQDAFADRFKGNDDKYWGWRSPVAPMFRPVPIVANQTVVSNISPTADGSVPLPAANGTQPAAAGGAPATGTAAAGAAPAAGGAAPPAAGGPPKKDLPALILPSRTLPTHLPVARGVPRLVRGSNLDPMFMRVEGQGPGSVTPFAENAYSVICGSIEAAILWSSFHNTTSLLTLHQYMKIKCVSPEVTISISGSWKSIQAHLSLDAKYNGIFWSAEVSAEFNYLRKSGDIKVKVFVDQTLPNADKIQESVDKRSDLVFQKFMELAQKVIFDPAPFNEKPAEAGGLFGGVALKMRADFAEVDLNYEETRQFTYLQDFPVSGDLTGLYDEIKADPEAEKKYFTTVYLSDWDRKLSRVVKPVVNWPDPARNWVGEPVSFLSVQVGYPNTVGEIQWDGHVFSPTDPIDASWSTATEQKKLADVSKPPANWTPDKTYIKRRIHFAEPPGEAQFPFARVAVEKNIVELDQGDYGILTTDTTLEVRVDNVGALQVGPIDLDVALEGDKQVVEVEIVADGKTWDGYDRQPVRFRWTAADQAEPRYWMIFTGQPDFTPSYKYKFVATVKGTLFAKGMTWEGPWVTSAGNGPLVISVLPQDDPRCTITKGLPPGYARTEGRLPPPSSSAGRVPPPRSAPALPSRSGWAAASPPIGTRSSPSSRTAPDRNGDVVFSGYSNEP